MKTIKNLLLTGIGVASLALTGCGDKKENIVAQKGNSALELEKHADSLNKLKSIDSIALNEHISIKITKDGFKQYNNGLLIREVNNQEKDALNEITDYFYNNKNQKIKSIDSFKYEDEKTGEEKIKKTDSTFYEYNDKGQLIKTEIFGGVIGVEYNGKQINFHQTTFYKYNEKGNKIEEITDENGAMWVDKYEYNEKGKLIKEEETFPNGEKFYSLFPNDFAKIVINDKNSDGLIDEVKEGK